MNLHIKDENERIGSAEVSWCEKKQGNGAEKKGIVTGHNYKCLL